MRRESFKKVLDKVATRMGMTPGQTLQVDQAAALAGYIDTRVRLGWEPYNWPFSRVLEERVYADRWDDLVSADIAQGLVVYHLGAYWRAMIDTPVDEPDIASDEWVEVVLYRKFIALVQPREIPISEVLDVWTSNPEDSSDARRVAFTLEADGILVSGYAGASVWVSFSRQVSRFTSTMWSPATAYVPGDLVYYANAGDCFECIEANTATPPPIAETSSYKWIRQELPYQLALYVEFGAWADALYEDEQDDKAARKERKADVALETEYDKIELKQKQTKRWRTIGR